MMWKLKLLLLAIFLMPVEPTPVPRRPVETVGDLWLDVSLGPPLVDWFNSVAQPTDIARLDNTSQLNLLDDITVGQKLLVFKSVVEAEHMLPEIADKIDIIGYNLEHNPQSPANEQANSVASVQRMRELADEYHMKLAFGPDHDFALSDGAAIAPYVDIFVLQVQRVQTEPETVYDFVLPLISELREANPDLDISVQVRTEGDVIAIANLIESLKEDLDGVSILTSPDTVPVAKALVEELRGQTAETETELDLTAEPAASTEAPIVGDDSQKLLVTGGVILAGVVGGGLTAFVIYSRIHK